MLRLSVKSAAGYEKGWRHANADHPKEFGNPQNRPVPLVPKPLAVLLAEYLGGRRSRGTAPQAEPLLSVRVQKRPTSLDHPTRS